MAFGEHDKEQHVKKAHAEKAPAVEAVKVHKISVKHVSAKTDKPRASMDESLRAIYENEEGEMPDMTKLDHKHTHGWLAALVGCVVLGLFAGAAYIGYLVFSPYVLNADANIDISIKAQENVSSFEETTLEVRYENVGRADVSGGELRLNLPPEFHITGTDPLPMSEPSTWAVASLAPGAVERIYVRGYFVAESGAREFLQGVVRYSPQGVSREYEDIATKTIAVGASKLGLAVEAPAEAVAGEKTTFVYRAKNNSEMKIEQIVLAPKLPASFLVNSSTPAAEADGTWKIGTLEKGQDAKVTITGTFSANHEESENLGGTVGIRVDAASVGKVGIAEQAEAVTPVRVASSDFVVRTLVNGSAESQSVDFGGRLRLSVVYKNAGNRAMKDVTVAVTVDGTPDGMVDWALFDKETDADKTFMRKGETITVNKKLFKGFEELAPGAEGTFTWNLPLVTKATSKTYSAKISSKSTIGMIGTSKVAKSVETTPFTVTPNSDLDMSTGAYYFNEDDAPIGSGPLPPIAGEETKYAIAWKLTNSVHELRDTVVRTQLAEGVTWTGKMTSSMGALTYDEATRTVTWRIDKLAAGAATLNAQFEVGLTPKKAQIDSFAPLTTGATLTSTDTVTKAILTQTGEPDTTELPKDDKAKGKGLVMEEKEG